MSWRVNEYCCETHGRFEVLERPYAVRRRQCRVVKECRRLCERVISAPRVKIPTWSVSTGRSEEPPPGAFDTRDIARKAGVDC